MRQFLKFATVGGFNALISLATYALLLLAGVWYVVATILAYVNPLVVWIWIGGLVLALGTGIAVWPTMSERRVTVSLPEHAVPAE